MTRTVITWLVFGYLVSDVMLAQPRGGKSFVLETERPFVELVFDRTGPWAPVFEGESSTGIWLRLRNNCSYPIIVSVLTRPNQNDGVLVAHEVQKVTVGVPLPPSEERPAPTIHGNYLGSDVRNTVEVPPGRALVAGMPIEHITRFTSVRVDFEIRFPKRASGRQPRMYLEYYWIDLPREVQIISDKVAAARSAK
jgi:hypothetical protein